MPNGFTGHDFVVVRQMDMNTLRAIPAFEHWAELDFKALVMHVVDDVTQFIIGRRHFKIPKLPAAEHMFLKYRRNKADPSNIEFDHFIDLLPGFDFDLDFTSAVADLKADFVSVATGGAVLASRVLTGSADSYQVTLELAPPTVPGCKRNLSMSAWAA